MADLLPIKAFADFKTSNAAKADPPLSSQPAAARFAAIDYARKITEAPDGSRITPTEKNVLLNLALFFNSESGTAWPRINTLSSDACMSTRHCRRNLARLERKQVIQRVYMRREGVGGQTSNEYFFPALGSPPQTPEAKARRQKIQKVSRAPMTAMRGQSRPGVADTSVRTARTNETRGPGHGRPPIESLGDCSIDLQSDSSSEEPAARSRAAKLRPAKSRKTFSNRGKAPFSDLGLARNAWNLAIEKVRTDHGAKEFKKYRLRDVTVVSADVDGAGTVYLTLRSPAPDKAELGIRQHETAISQALRGFYGCTVKVRVIRDGLANAQNNQGRIPSANAQDCAASE